MAKSPARGCKLMTSIKNHKKEDLYKPYFPDDWEDKILHDLAEWKNGLAFRDISFSDNGMPVIKITELKNGITNQTKFTNQIFDNTVFLTKNDMVFSWSGNPETSIDVFWYNLPDGWLNQHIFKITTKQEIDENFFFYILKYLKPNFTKIASNKQTTGLGHVTINDLKQICIKIPPLPTQRAIAATLSCLDDKIEMNSRINHYLEQMAQGIYDQFFGLGKQVGRLSDICRYSDKKIAVATLSPQTYISTENMLLNKAGYTETTSLPQFARTTKFDSGDVLVSNIRPYFKKIVYCNFTGGCSTDVLCFLAANSDLSAFLYCTLYRDQFFDHMLAGSKGTKMPRGDKRQIMNYPVVIPDKKTLLRFSNSVNPILIHKCHLSAENRVLAAIRDTLLPKLMSGKIKAEER
ncbi:MAG: restriction endonuclease subunit S [Prevotellaceae bacterium]|jgi:type I restriction enzyme S subunit|nr:restriction endonuclease subunit S [Prevotellaceae bacterium]